MLYPVELRAQRGPVYRTRLHHSVGRGRGIRTLDIQLPKLALYQAELYPDRSSVFAELFHLAKQKGAAAPFENLARPERFELPTTKFVAWYSIQLSYGRVFSGNRRRRSASAKKRNYRGI